MHLPVNIEEIVCLILAQYPQRPDVIQALAHCPNGTWTGNAYYQFIDSSNANQPGAEWQFAENIVLRRPGKDDIILDVLQNGQVGGIEFMEFI